MKLLGFNVFTRDIRDILLQKNKQIIINTINPHSYIVSLHDPKFRQALKDSDVLLPDGFGILIASRVLNGRSIDKFTGPDALNSTLDYLNDAHGRIYFLGSTEKVLSRIEKKIKKRYVNICVASHSPPFSDAFTQSEAGEILKSIKNFNPDVLCVGMTAPKQEKWVFSNKDKLPDCHIMCIGAAFDWFSETKAPPLQISEMFHLVWLERFFREPVRMMPRMKSMVHFLYIVLINKLKCLLQK